jgi:hypothetical protein
MTIKKLFFFFVILIAGMDIGIGQSVVRSPTPDSQDDKRKQSEQEKEKKLQREREIQNLVITAANQPIEIAADILFTALDAKLLKDPKQQREVIESLFRRASEAKEPYRKAFRQGNLDTRAGYLGYAYDQELDSLSIQLRAIKRMMALDKQKARSLFREMPDVRLKPLTCEDELDYEISQFYQVLKNIVDETFDTEARQRREHIYFAVSYIDSIDSPVQVPSVIDLLSTVQASPPEFDILLDSFTRALHKLAIDPRSFAFSITYGRATSEVKYTLVPKIERAASRPDQFLGAFRQYLVKQLSATQCADSQMTGKPEKQNSNVEFANTLFKNPITEDEIKPEKIDAGAKRFEYWHTPKSAKLLTSIRKLRFGDTKTELILAERSTQKWRQSLMEFMQEMNEWKPEDEKSEADYFHQRNVLYDSLVRITPGSLRAVVLLDYALFLRDSRMQKTSPIEWLYYVKRLLREGKSLTNKEHDEFINILRVASTEYIPLYLDLERLLGTGSWSNQV